MVKSLLNRAPPNHRHFFHVISPLQTPNQDNLANLALSHHRLLFEPSQGLNLLTSSKVCEPQEVLSAHSTPLGAPRKFWPWDFGKWHQVGKKFLKNTLWAQWLLGYDSPYFLAFIKVYRGKKIQFLLGNASAKNLKPRFHSYSSEKREEKEKKKKKKKTLLKLIVAFSAVTVNILWMDTSEQRIQIKIPYNYLSKEGFGLYHKSLKCKELVNISLLRH